METKICFCANIGRNTRVSPEMFLCLINTTPWRFIEKVTHSSLRYYTEFGGQLQVQTALTQRKQPPVRLSQKVWRAGFLPGRCG